MSRVAITPRNSFGLLLLLLVVLLLLAVLGNNGVYPKAVRFQLSLASYARQDKKS